KLSIVYASGQTDRASVVAGPTDPRRAMPRLSLPHPTSDVKIGARWLGQDGAPGSAPGDVHLALSGLPSGRPVVAAVLSDAVRGCWVYRGEHASAQEFLGEGAPLTFRAGRDPTQADVFFAPIRDESDRNLTLRLVLGGGGFAVARFPGGKCDP